MLNTHIQVQKGLENATESVIYNIL